MMVDMNALRSWIAVNPGRERTLPQRSTFRKGNETAEQLSLNVPGGGDQWITLSVQPAGPLSAMLMILDEEYVAAPANLRERILMERVLEYQEGLDALKGVRRFARHMKRVRELFATDPSRLDDTGRALLWDALCTMKGIQTVVFSESKGTASGPQIAFSPADPRMWESARPIFAVDEGLTRVFKPLRPAVAKQLASWLGEREAAGVPIIWPAADGTKGELVEWLRARPATWKEDDAKMKKDELAEIAGRAQAIELFSSWARSGTFSTELMP